MLVGEPPSRTFHATPRNSPITKGTWCHGVPGGPAEALKSSLSDLLSRKPLRLMGAHENGAEIPHRRLPGRIPDYQRRTKGDQREAEKCGWVNSHRRHLKASAVELGWMEHILREVT